MLVAVPCAGADTVLLLDAADGSRLGEVAVGSHPVHLADVGGRVFVATMGERSVSVVADGEVTRVDTGTLGPSHFAESGDRLLVPCTGGDALAIIDNQHLSLVDRVGVGAEPHDVAVHEGLAYVGSRTDGTVSVVDPETGELLETVAVGERVQGVDAGFGAVYAVDQAGGRIARLTESGVTATAPVGANPYDAAIGSDCLLVPGRDDGTVTALSPDLTERRTHELGGVPNAVVRAGGEDWVLDRERALAHGLASDEALSLPYGAFAGAAVEDGLVVSHYDDDALSRVGVDGEVVWTVETPAEPFEPLVV